MKWLTGREETNDARRSTPLRLREAPTAIDACGSSTHSRGDEPPLMTSIDDDGRIVRGPMLTT
jgi:hypothetical protein